MMRILEKQFWIFVVERLISERLRIGSRITDVIEESGQSHGFELKNV